MSAPHIVTACQGMPPGFSSPCGVILEPHGPHDITAEQAVTPISQDVSVRFDRLDPQDGELHYVIGWLISLNPAAVDDALDALEAYRAKRAELRSRKES
jgi:hypothetical protein